jgi:hypothetical protein
MAKFECNCGNLLIDQSDFLRDKAWLIADQDYFDLLDAAENQPWQALAATVGQHTRRELWQCSNCHSLILFSGSRRFDFQPVDAASTGGLLASYLGEKWPGTLSASFRNGTGEIFCNTNLESGFRQNLSLSELRELYHRKQAELQQLGILRHSFLSIDGAVEHQFPSAPTAP